jgi:hypothetical protein
LLFPIGNQKNIYPQIIPNPMIFPYQILQKLQAKNPSIRKKINPVGCRKSPLSQGTCRSTIARPPVPSNTEASSTYATNNPMRMIVVISTSTLHNNRFFSITHLSFVHTVKLLFDSALALHTCYDYREKRRLGAETRE